MAGHKAGTRTAAPSSASSRASTQRGKRTGVPQAARNMDRAPKSMVLRVGSEDVGRSVRQLVLDMRQVMQPDTAARLKERRKNRLKDFTVMAGPLGVTHFLLFSRSDKGNTHMRLAIAPRGPTLSFRVEQYSLCNDIARTQRRPKGFDGLHRTPPLTAGEGEGEAEDQANKSQVPRHLESLVTTIFQSLFPPVSPQTMPLSSIKRVLLLNREPPSHPANSPYTITLRHYGIGTKSRGHTKAIKRIDAAGKVCSSAQRGKGMPNLGQLGDVADYLIDVEAGNYTSASESEPDTDAEVEVVEQQTTRLQRKHGVADKGSSRPDSGRLSTEKRAVKLTEIGPRMRLRLLRIEEGLCEGKVMWHESIEKTVEEQAELDEKWEARRKEREARKKQQRENVERKKREKAAKNEDGKSNHPANGDGDEDEDEDMEDYDDWEDDSDLQAEG